VVPGTGRASVVVPDIDHDEFDWSELRPREPGSAYPPPPAPPSVAAHPVSTVPEATTEILEPIPLGEPIDLAELQSDEVEDLAAASQLSPAADEVVRRDLAQVRPVPIGVMPAPAEVSPVPDTTPTLRPVPDTTLRAPQQGNSSDGGEAQLREAISRASREVIERIAWEIIPTLAESIIREHVERLVKERQR
jgi:hypothetical protein